MIWAATERKSWQMTDIVHPLDVVLLSKSVFQKSPVPFVQQSPLPDFLF